MRTARVIPRSGLAVRSATAIVGLGLLAAACTSGSPPGSRASASPGIVSGVMGGNPTTTLKTENSSFGTVLTDGLGYTLYWFDKDTATKSACTGVCVSNWPPVTGAPKPAAGLSLPGQLGTFTRSDGTVQATYDGHPLYTYAGDPGPDQVGGNDIVEYGGIWYAMTVHGVAVQTPSH